MLILFATLLEAKSSLEQLGAKQITESQFDSPAATIVITGMGVYNALAAVITHGHKHDLIVNMGFAGALNSTLTLGTIASIKRVSKYTHLPHILDETSAALHLKSTPHLDLQGEYTLASSDFPLHHETTRTTICADLIDMEGYGIAYGAKQLKKKCLIEKVVSDFAATNGRHYILNNSHKYAQIIALRLAQVCAQHKD